MTEKKSRYLGVQPFKTSDQQLFFGRDEDIENLHDFILLEKMVVLFGKSGYGKSSLLNAGIVPRLLAPDQPGSFRYMPVEVRFTDYAGPQAASPLQTLARLISDLPADSDGDFLSTAGTDDSLWILLKRRQQSASGRFVLLFDQFEEFFSYPPAQQEVFRRQLAELLFTDIPQALRQKQDTLGDEARRYLASPMNIKAVFVIRSDRMSLLDSMKDTLPAILHKRYELRPLTTDQARDAIVQPARLAGDAFNSPPFEYTEDGLQAILDALGNSSHTDTETAGIEAFQLQIICEYLENRVRDGHVHDLDGNGLPDITREELPEMDTLYEQYYHRKLGELKPEEREKARLVLENILLAEDSNTGEGRRKSVDKIDLLNTGIKSELLEELEKTYLIRRERNTVGGYNYEISHDTLLAPVMKAKKERLEQEAAVQRENDRLEAMARAQQAEAAAAEERRKAEEAERLQKRAEENEQRARQRTVLAGIVAVLALILAIYAYNQQREAKLAEQKADDSARLAAEQRDIADINARQALEQRRLAEEKTEEARANLERAQAEESRALAALKQVEKEKNATEEQRRRAEDNYAEARKATESARKAKEEAERNLASLKLSNEAIVRSLLKNARENMHDRRYQESFEKIKSAWSLGILKGEIEEACLNNIDSLLNKDGYSGMAISLLTLSDSLMSEGGIEEGYIRISRNHILNMRHDSALIAARFAVEKGTQSASVSALYFELSYWYCETGSLDKSFGLLDTAFELRGIRFPDVTLDTVSLHGAMRKFDLQRYEFLHDRYYPKMVDIAGGVFSMGSPESDTHSDDSERPVHRVTLSSYSMSATEVTVFQFGLYCALSDDRDIRDYIEWPNSGDHPVENVSWYDAVEYANWLSARRGVKVMYKIDKDIKDPNNLNPYDDLKWTVEINSGVGGYRLPTESEWEYAARGGNKSKGSIYAGGDSLALVGWYWGNGGFRTHPVGEKMANELGLYDMSGNVWEWCWDWYGSYSADEQVNPRGAEKGDGRVSRGGSWHIVPPDCRAAYRNGYEPSSRIYFLGFRLVSSLQ